MTRRAALLVALVLTLMAGDGFSPLGPITSGAENALPRVAPGFFDPAQRLGSAYKNVDPEYRRASYWARLRSLVVGATWLVSERRVAALPLGTPDWAALRDRRIGEVTAQREALVRAARVDDHPERRGGLLRLAHGVAQLLEVVGGQPGVLAVKLAEKAGELAKPEPRCQSLGTLDLAVGLHRLRRLDLVERAAALR